MNVELSMWNCGLLFAALSVALGVAGVVSSEDSRTRWQASGLVLQGIVLMFVAGFAYFPGSVDLRLGGLTLVGLLIIHTLLMPSPESEGQSHDENQTW